MIDEIQDEDKKFLLKVARDAIWTKLVNEDLPVYYKDKELYRKKIGVVVKLKVDNNLCGYTGNTDPTTTLIETIQRCSINAAFYDPRFVPLTKEEYENLSIEIFVIREILELKNLKTLNPQQDGLFIKSKHITGLILPDDFEKFNLTPEEYLKEADLKLGIPPDAENIQYFIVDFIKISE